MTEPCWRRSSFSGNQGDCVELASTLDAVRDSKNPACGLRVAGVRELLAAVRGERLPR